MCQPGALNQRKLLIGFGRVADSAEYEGLRDVPADYAVLNAQDQGGSGGLVSSTVFETGVRAGLLRLHRVWEPSADNLVVLREQNILPALIEVFGDERGGDTTATLDAQLRCELYAHTPRHAAAAAHLVTTGVGKAQRAALWQLFAHESAFRPPRTFRVTALMAGFNEGDVMRSSIWHLLTQGCSVHYIDNWSTDNSMRMLRRLQRDLQRAQARHGDGPLRGLTLTTERFPVTADTGTYDWARILRRKAQLAGGTGTGSTEVASAMAADWFVHVDPDEIRESPWGPDVSLRRALFVAQVLGYNLVNFNKLVVFHPVQGAPPFPADGSGDLGRAFEYWDTTYNYNDGAQVKAWRSYPRGSVDTNLVDLSISGGHRASFASRLIAPRVFPWSFVLRHYPIRSQAHGLRKVLKERRARWNADEVRKRKWHVQYRAVSGPNASFVKQRDGLRFAARGALPASVYEDELPCVDLARDRPHQHVSMSRAELRGARCHALVLARPLWCKLFALVLLVAAWWSRYRPCTADAHHVPKAAGLTV
eukprot:g7851.t1